ncbi:unnamed protein product [Effrenium voratum]|uniref:Uncharacterized protein n=1 Tax=Effrenium voratum TaxID=2562239 RepID=A0AA36IFH0_9DINO|nr:unnamed protein product [Effrenium voratum]
MGCASSVARGPNLPQHDVCVTCTSPVTSGEDFARFFGDWIMKACAEMKLSCISSRPQLGPELPKEGSQLERHLRQALVYSRVAVCIMNMSKGCEMPPPGYKAEVTWADQRSIPLVPFYDADRYDWKEVAAWKAQLPKAFRSGLGPVRYMRTAHEEAKQQLQSALQKGLKDLEQRDVGDQQRRSGRLVAAVEGLAGDDGNRAMLGQEFSRAELRLKDDDQENAALRRTAAVAEEADLEDSALGLDRSDFERAGLAEKRLERTNSMRDINLDSALAILAKGGSHGTRGRDPLAPREGGCRLQLIADVSADLLEGNDPKHRICAPVKGILRKARTAVNAKAASSVKHLRLAPEALEERRFLFSVQLLQKHLDGLRTEDVHELLTVLKVLQHGGTEMGLVTRGLRLLRSFLEEHLILHDRAIQQNMVQIVVDVMRQQPEVDVLTLGVAVLCAVLSGAAQRGVLGLEAQSLVGSSSLAATQTQDLVTSVSRSGGVMAILDGMQRFGACEGLQERGCVCLALLTAGSEDNQVSPDYAKGRHQESSVLLRSQSRHLVVRQGGIELLLGAMRRFMRSCSLQRAACLALGQLAVSELKVKEGAAEEGAITLLMQVLRQHRRDACGAPRFAAHAVRHFACHSLQTKGLIAQQGGVEELHELAQRGLEASGDRAAATEALGALCHLASKHAENKLRIFDAGCLELAFDALKGDGRGAAKAPAENEVEVETEAEAMPEAELAMAACGLLHNMSVDPAIRGHVVKLGGRLAAQRLQGHPDAPVKNLAKLLAKTLKPPEDSGDPFGALFATRTPGLSAPRRVASKKERQIRSQITSQYEGTEETDRV